MARQRLEQRTERNGCAGVDGPSNQHWQPSTCCHIAELLHEPGLADTRLACHPHEAASASDGLIECGRETRRLITAPDNRRARHLQHRDSLAGTRRSHISTRYVRAMQRAQRVEDDGKPLGNAAQGGDP